MRLSNDLYNPEDIEKIHKASIELLIKKGVKFNSERALNVFRNAGARIEGSIVYINERMVNAALSCIPPKFLLLARKEKNNFEIGGGKICFCLPDGPIFVKKGNKYSSSKSTDVINFIKLSENSPLINMVSPWVATANDVSNDKQLKYQLAVALKYSTKPTLGLVMGYEISKFSINFIRDFYDKHEENDYVCLGLIGPISPLAYDGETADAVIAYAEENQPLCFSSAVLPGATAPVTLAGAIALANTEMLAGIVLAQLVRPGVPIIYGNAGGSTDLRYVTPAIGSPEAGLTAIYVRGLANKYHMPCRSGGALCDSKNDDAQAGIEGTMVMLPTIIANTDFIIHSVGILDSYNIISYDKFLMDEEMSLMCLYIREGIRVDDETLAVDVINAVEHGGQYLMEEHTYNHMKASLHLPKYFEKGYYDLWHNNGGKTAVDNALAAVDKRLHDYKETLLNCKQEKMLEKYLN